MLGSGSRGPLTRSIILGIGTLGLASLWALLAEIPAFPARSPAPNPQPELLRSSVRPSTYVEAATELLELGKAVYQRQCAPCHGVKGDGQGEAAFLLYPKPRDFTRGEFRIVSSWDKVPTDGDLYQTISRGMPGSAMPSWSHLPERTRWALVHWVKTFPSEPLEIKPDREPENPGERGTGILHVPPRPRYDEQTRERARTLFVQGCAPCHGESGKGDGVVEQQDSQGYPTRPRDLTAGIFKGVPESEEVYKRIVLGLPGSPMPSSDYLHGSDAWALTGYILSLSSPQQRERVEMKRYLLVARRVERLPEHPDAGHWQEVTPVELHLMPLWWEPGRTAALTVQALHDGKELALLLQWADETHDHTAIRPQDFRDAAAIQFSRVSDPPFFGMGETASPVSIWMWKSERQADLQPAFQDLEKVYPNLGIDSYPNLQRSPLEQPVHHALTLESDPDFITAWGAGNIVADPTRESAVENLSAQGLGTLRARPTADQNVHAAGTYQFGSYQVVFRRSLHDVKSDSPILAPGDTVPVAFAIWDGSAGDRDGKKSVTIWQELYIEP